MQLLLKLHNIILIHTLCFSSLEPSLLEKLLSNIPEQTIKFKVYKRDHIPPGIKTDRRLNRVRNQNKLPLGVWATWITESILTYIYIYTYIIVENYIVCSYMQYACINPTDMKLD